MHADVPSMNKRALLLRYFIPCKIIPNPEKAIRRAPVRTNIS